MINLPNGVVKKTKRVKFNPIKESIVFSNKTSPSIIQLQTPIKSILEREPVIDEFELDFVQENLEERYSFDNALLININRLGDRGMTTEQIYNSLLELYKVNKKWKTTYSKKDS